MAPALTFSLPLYSSINVKYSVGLLLWFGAMEILIGFDTRNVTWPGPQLSSGFRYRTQRTSTSVPHKENNNFTSNPTDCRRLQSTDFQTQSLQSLDLKKREQVYKWLTSASGTTEHKIISLSFWSSFQCPNTDKTAHRYQLCWHTVLESLTIWGTSKLFLQLDDKQFEGKDQTFYRKWNLPGSKYSPLYLPQSCAHSRDSRDLSLLTYMEGFRPVETSV